MHKKIENLTRGRNTRNQVRKIEWQHTQRSASPRSHAITHHTSQKSPKSPKTSTMHHQACPHVTRCNRTSHIAPITKIIPNRPKTIQSQVVGIENAAFKHRCDVWTMDENSRIGWDGIVRIVSIVSIVNIVGIVGIVC